MVQKTKKGKTESPLEPGTLAVNGFHLFEMFEASEDSYST
jgi:hypothetical protein